MTVVDEFISNCYLLLRGYAFVTDRVIDSRSNRIPFLFCIPLTSFFHNVIQIVHLYEIHWMLFVSFIVLLFRCVAWWIFFYRTFGVFFICALLLLNNLRRISIKMNKPTSNNAFINNEPLWIIFFVFVLVNESINQ